MISEKLVIHFTININAKRLRFDVFLNLPHFASEGGNVAIIKTMLSRGLDINSKDSNGDTAQPRSQGLLLDDFQNGESSGEDPGKGWVTW